MGLTLRHRPVLCCTFHPWDRHKDMWNRDKQSTAVSQRGSTGHMELVTHTRAVLMLSPFPRAFSSTWRISDCEHTTDLGTWHSKGSQQKEQSALLCFVTVIKHGVKL